MTMTRAEAAAIAATVVRLTLDGKGPDILALISTFSAEDYVAVFLELGYLSGGLCKFFDQVAEQNEWPGRSEQILKQVAADAAADDDGPWRD